MKRKALVVWGGWDGHTPEATARVLEKALEESGFSVRMENSLAPLANTAALKKMNLIVPMWTMGSLQKEEWNGLNKAVQSGVGIAGVHGGAGDAFRSNLEYQWMIGGQFVGHPYIGNYTVRLTEVKSLITKGMKTRFKYKSEQYYMIVDPGIKVLADTVYQYDGHKITMPVVWTKTWGNGRVFYSALGHVAEEFSAYPDVLAMTTRGMLWASKK